MGIEAQEIVRRKTQVPFRLAYKLVLFFMVLYFARPEDWIPGVHYLHLAKVVGSLAIIAFLAELGSARRPWPREVVYLFLLTGWMFLSVPFSPVWRGGAFSTTHGFANVVPMILVISLAVNTQQRLRRILFWQVVAVAVIAVVAVVKFRHAEGRLIGVLNGVYNNPNEFALAVVIAIPICLAFMLRSRNTLVKFVWLCCIAVMTYSVVLSASRAGILAFALAMAVTLWHFSIKGRYRYLLTVFGVLAICALLVGGGELKTRFEAMYNPQLDESAYGSAQQRDMLLKKSIAMTFEHPIFGLGPGNFSVVSGAWRVTHNTYTQMSSETGLPGFIFYMLILWCAWKNLRRARRMSPRRTELYMFSAALHGSLSGFLLGSFFASEGYQYFTYFLIAYTTAVYQIAKQQTQTMLASAQPIEASREERLGGEQPRETAWSAF